MKLKFELGKFFTGLYFSLLFGVLGVFFYWQYSTIKEFHKIELNNFFMQTNKIVNVLIEKKKSEIRDLIFSNFKSYSNDGLNNIIDIGDLDFMFFTKNNQITQLNGYSLFVDVEKLATKIKEETQLNKIVQVTTVEKTVFLIVHKEKVIDSKLGKVLGELWGVSILNENIALLQEFKQNTGVENLAIVTLDDEIISSSLSQNKMKTILNQSVHNEDIIMNKQFLYDNENLKMVFLIDSNKYKNLFEQFKNKALIAMIFLIFFGIVLYITIKMRFINKLSDLKYFIQSSLKNNNVKYEPSSIMELDTIASEFEHLFIRFRNYQDNLEETVREKTTENIKQMEILQQQSKLAQMGEMIGAIAHQWRQPLNVITTGIQNLKYDYKDGNLEDEEFIKNFIAENKKTIKFMSKTIDDFRSFFRTDKEAVDFKVKETVQSVLDMQLSQLRSNNIKITHEGEEFIYKGLQSEFQQVILNLINNAKDALVENKIQNPKIDINISENKVTIQDNAGGIPNELKNRIFEPYFTTKEQGKGTGIGLYISKMIIEDNMRSKLDVKNIDNGAAFTITLK